VKKSTFKELVADIRFFGICFSPVVLALLAWAVHADGLFQFLRVLFSVLWFFGAIASIIYASVALNIQRAKFKEELGQMHDPMYLDRRSVEAYRWQKASWWWMLAAGCALASLLMLAVTAWRCVYGSS
jgi:hypothetical protein